MTRSRWIAVPSTAVVVAAAALYLRDPPWLGGLTLGLRPWQTDRGARVRWTAGHASFFVPAETAAVTLPMRAVYPSGESRPVTVSISVDDRPAATVELPDPARWVDGSVTLPRRTSSRRVRRIDLRVSRTVGPSNFGVQLGEMRLIPG